MTPGQIAIIGAISTVIAGFGGAALGAWFASMTGMKLVQETNRNTASSKLRAAFAPAQSKIRLDWYSDGRKLRDFFYDELFIHAAAFEEFRPFASDGSAYQMAWNEYQQTINHNRGTNNEEYTWTSNMLETEEGIYEIRFTEIIIQKIKAILHFAPIK